MPYKDVTSKQNGKWVGSCTGKNTFLCQWFHQVCQFPTPPHTSASTQWDAVVTADLNAQ